ncbi:MAG: hypothetical protein D6696_17735, partial [Acidobacteria bacterium]
MSDAVAKRPTPAAADAAPRGLAGASGLRWQHDRLGRSLPIARPLRRATLGLGILALAAGAAAGWGIYRALVPPVVPL